MTREEIVTAIRDFLEDAYPHEGKTLSDTTDLLNGWFVDSLGIIQTVVFLEETFDVDVQADDVNEANFFSIATLADYVEKRIKG